MDLIKLRQDTKQLRRLRKQDYLKYIGTDLPIQHRRIDDPTKINNKIENPFRTEIVDQIVGYLFGNPITYTLKNDYPDTTHDYFNRFMIRNTLSDLDAETGVRMASTGVAFRLCYIAEDGYERVTLIPSDQAYVIHDADGEPMYGVWFKEYEDTDEIELFDDTNVYRYELNGSQLNLIEEREHGFSYCPMIQFNNNDQQLSDFFKVESEIDAYDRLISDAQNEMEEHRLSYMAFKGFNVDEEEVKQAKKLGGFEIPDGGDINFITKDIPNDFIESHKRTLAENIYKFSKTVDMSDEKFSGGTQSGESRKWKLLTLENRAITKERKFTKALRYQWKVLASSFARRDINIDYLDVNATFSRNVPVELQHEADVQQKLFGLVSDELRLSLFSKIDDPRQELDRIEEEKDRPVISDYED